MPKACVKAQQVFSIQKQGKRLSEAALGGRREPALPQELQPTVGMFLVLNPQELCRELQLQRLGEI